ncbi:MAG: tRNA pseudouridine(55) synthase TruB [Planctomycetaceae bacterium]
MIASEKLFGVLNLLKPGGITSRDLVNRVQRLVKPAKVGHAGTLDPMATGVLLVCVGPATKLISVLQEGAKTYRTEFTFGITSDTDDATGKISFPETAVEPRQLTEITRYLETMTGNVLQVPPDFSAVHVNGQRAYALARRGETVELNAKTVRIDEIRILNYSWPKLELEITCGSGTYIRSIARDLGLQLGCGALMSRLERTRVGIFSITESLPEDQITIAMIRERIRPAMEIVAGLAAFDCSADDVGDLVCGRIVRLDRSRLRHAKDVIPGDTVALTRKNFSELLALAVVTENLHFQPRTVFVAPEVG